jgi:hypothetical protein
MKNNRYFLNTVLVVVLFVAGVIGMIVKVMLPDAVFPPLNIPNMVLLSVIALYLEHLIAPNNPRCYICIPIFGVLSFGILPLFAGFACQHTFWKIGLVGGIVFTVVTYLFTSVTDRLQTGPKARGALLFTCLGIFLAAQCFAGIIL